MADVRDVVRTYDDTLTIVRNISDQIQIISPADVPFVKLVGLEPFPGQFDFEGAAYQIIWIEDALHPMVSGAAATAASDGTSLTVTSAHGVRFRSGDVLLVGTEQIWVSSVSTDTLTIVRAFGGTTAASIATGTANVAVLSRARLEGQAASDDLFQIRTTVGNYTQIFQGESSVSGSRNITKQHGIGAELDYQVAKKFKELMIFVDKQMYKGQSASGTNTAARAFGGLDEYITDNTSGATGTALTEKAFIDAVQSAYYDGGNPDTVMCRAWGRRKISSLYEGLVRTERSEKAGGVLIDVVDTHFGSLQLVLDRWAPDDRMYGIMKEKVGLVSLRPFAEAPLARDGDRVRRDIVGELSMIVANDKAHFWINYSSTA